MLDIRTFLFGILSENTFVCEDCDPKHDVAKDRKSCITADVDGLVGKVGYIPRQQYASAHFVMDACDFLGGGFSKRKTGMDWSISLTSGLSLWSVLE